MSRHNLSSSPVKAEQVIYVDEALEGRINVDLGDLAGLTIGARKDMERHEEDGDDLTTDNSLRRMRAAGV